ncbi:MAG: hypothetical protein C0401_12485 [Anaerolinea sp.]|nr:hypothetical protein [Anaerolinea sp.]
MLPDRIDFFRAWLDSELSQRGLTDIELARRGGISHAVISRARHGQIPGWEACKGIAKGLGLPAEVVFRAAGHLPPDPKSDATIMELLNTLAGADEQQKKEILHYARYIIESAKK